MPISFTSAFEVLEADSRRFVTGPVISQRRIDEKTIYQRVVHQGKEQDIDDINDGQGEQPVKYNTGYMHRGIT